MPLGLQEGSGGASYSDACLGDEGVREVCASLASLPSLPLLTSLDLRGNHIHADGAAAVAKLLLTSGCALQLVRATPPHTGEDTCLIPASALWGRGRAWEGRAGGQVCGRGE